MEHSSVFAISSAGMALERARIEAAALNLANAHTTAPPGEPAYRPLRVVATGGAGAFAATLAAAAPRFHTESADAPPRLVQDAGHPAADERGYVSYPAIDPAAEMIALMTAMRAYEANVAALNTARSLALKALDIGGTT